MAGKSAKFMSALHSNISERFNFEEVRSLCFELNIDFDNVPGNTKSAFIRNLIVSLAREGRLQELVNLVREKRSFINWQDVPANFQLPKDIAQEDIQQVVNYHVYSGDVVHGDKVAGDKVGGDKISVGNIDNAEGLAIGRGSSASVNKGEAPTERPSTISNLTVQEAVDELKDYLDFASRKQKEVADELTKGMNLILNLAAQQPVDTLHLKLLCLGQQQLAQEIGGSVHGLDEVVAQFVTAVQQQ
ncbi:hypothetical protein [Candidatus Leptofilum sp.]|uniref:hypothetical protein n=1 Tax=Candidatus Leptofilum sp. TaxID=3241576 RepID=UPI003B5AB9F4